MRTLKIALAAAAVIGLVSAPIAHAQAPAAPAAPAAPKAKPFDVGQPAIDFTIKNFESGKDFQLQPLVGKKKLMFVWLSSSCSSCLAEMQELKAAAEEGKLKDVDVYVVSIDFKEDGLKAYNEAFVHESFTLLHDKKFASAQKYGLRSTPATLIIGKDGLIAYKDTGFESGESKALIDTLGKVK